MTLSHFQLSDPSMKRSEKGIVKLWSEVHSLKSVCIQGSMDKNHHFGCWITADERCYKHCFEERLSKTHFFWKGLFQAKIAFFFWWYVHLCNEDVFSVKMTQLSQTLSVKYFHFYAMDLFYKKKKYRLKKFTIAPMDATEIGPKFKPPNEDANTGPLPGTLSV